MYVPVARLIPPSFTNPNEFTLFIKNLHNKIWLAGWLDFMQGIVQCQFLEIHETKLVYLN